MRLLEGAVMDQHGEVCQRCEHLEAELRELRRELHVAKAEARSASADAARAVSALRKQLNPLYRALQAVFGEMEAFGSEESSNGAPAMDSRSAAVWASWKSKLGGRKAEAIDALLLHGELNTTQLAIAMKCSKGTIPGVVFELNKCGLLNKNGGRFSLKQL